MPILHKCSRVYMALAPMCCIVCCAGALHLHTCTRSAPLVQRAQKNCAELHRTNPALLHLLKRMAWFEGVPLLRSWNECQGTAPHERGQAIQVNWMDLKCCGRKMQPGIVRWSVWGIDWWQMPTNHDLDNRTVLLSNYLISCDQPNSQYNGVHLWNRQECRYVWKAHAIA